MSLLSTLGRLLHERREYRFYAWDGPRPEERPALPHGFKLDHFITPSEAPLGLALGTGIAPGPLGLPRNVMTVRMRKGKASIIVLHRRNRVVAYGWLQSWGLFEDKFGTMAQAAVMLGPYYTEPEFRGQGFYGLLLQESLRLAPKDKRPVIFTDVANASCIRGIEKTGFKPLGVWRVSSWLQRFHKTEKI